MDKPESKRARIGELGGVVRPFSLHCETSLLPRSELERGLSRENLFFRLSVLGGLGIAGIVMVCAAASSGYPVDISEAGEGVSWLAWAMMECT